MLETNSPTAEPACPPRKRGRPRTITDDKEIPERRRKQLRVAQQAYRKRKETTINTLQTRVDELESGVDKLSQSFLSFSTLLLEENILEYHPRIGLALQDITRQCVSLAKQGCDESDHNAPVGTVHRGSSGQSTAANELNVNHEFDSEINSKVTMSQSDRSNSSSSSPPAPVSNQWIDLSIPPTPPDHEPVISSYDSFLSGSSIPASLTSPGIIDSPANLINRGRWSLSHRIVRECSLNGYELLVYSPHLTARIQAVWGAILTESQLEWGIKGLYNTMIDEVGDMVDSRSKVLSPLYPMKDEPELVTRYWQLIADSVAGEWLDANGVQKLLREKGFDIQPDISQSCGFRVNPANSLNVAKFLNTICRNCVCIGSGPAFKRDSVERALLQATQSNGPWGYTPLCPTSN